MKLQIIFGGQYDCWKGPLLDVSSEADAIEKVKEAASGRQYGAWGNLKLGRPAEKFHPEGKGICCKIPSRIERVSSVLVSPTGTDFPRDMDLNDFI